MKSLLFILLLPFSFIYAGSVILRNWLFDQGILKSRELSVPVISVGNIAAGGTGKTTMVEYVARMLLQQRLKAAVLSRGYKRSTKGYQLVSDGSKIYANSETAGDEPMQLGSSLEGCVIAVDENRIHGGQRLIQDFNIDVIILDDGFQHRWLHRDLDIVLMNCITPSLYRYMLPSGRRREPLWSLRRADMLIATKCNDETKYQSIVNLAKRYAIPHVLRARRKIIDCREIGGGNSLPVSELKGKNIYCFSGIAYPDDFVKTVEDLGAYIVGKRHFTDHYRYSQTDVENIIYEARKVKTDMIVTTEKDAARLNGMILKDDQLLKFYSLQIALQFSDEERTTLHERIFEILPNRK